MTELVSTYVRPPTIEDWDEASLSVWANQVCIADGPAIIYREETHPPCFYFPPQQVNMDLLEPNVMNTHSYCEFKGAASYYDISVPPESDGGTGYIASMAAWTYLDPYNDYHRLKDYIAFYPGKVTCYVGSEIVQSESNRYYGGWIWSGVEFGNVAVQE